MMQHSIAEHIPQARDTNNALKDALVRLSAPVSNKQHADLIPALLREIDETVLPRQIVVYFDQVAVAQLTVSHRRLLSLDITTGRPSSNSTGQNSTAQLYAQRLHQLASAQKGACFRISRHPCETGVETESCPVGLLTEAIATMQETSRLTRLVAAVGDDALAWTYHDAEGADPSGAGPEALVHRLAALTSAMKNRNATPRVPDQTPGCMVLSMTADMRVVLAWDRSEVLLIALPTQVVSKATNSWREIFS